MPRNRAALIAVICAAAASAAPAHADVNGLTISSNPTAGSPVALTTFGTADFGTNALTLLYAPNSSCTAVGQVAIASHALARGGFAFTDSFTPPAAGTYCIFVELAGFGPGRNSGNSQHNQTIVVAAAPSGSAPPANPATSGTQPGAGPTTTTPPSTGTTSVFGPLASSAGLRRTATGRLVASLHLLRAASGHLELLISASLAHRLGIHARPDLVTHGRYVVLDRVALGNARAGTTRERLQLTSTAAARLANAGPVDFALRTTLVGSNRQVQILVEHLTAKV
jgi:hypothetical protein